MNGLVDVNGMPITGNTKRREMKSGQIKHTRWGDIAFKLTIDLPKEVPEDDFKKAVVEYGNILVEAFRK